MLRATVWTVGLFGAGAAISRLFPGAWTEPLVLLGLGVALLFVSSRTARTTIPVRDVPVRTARPAGSADAPAGVPAKAPAVAAAAATVQGATVQVERSA